jgi:hypothetical protein
LRGVVELVVQLDGAFGESFEPSIQRATSRAGRGEVVLKRLATVLMIFGKIV